MSARLMPRQPVPALEVELVGGGRWSLAAQRPQHFTMLVFYRGLHCPVCRNYLGELNGLADRFAARGVAILALSSDGSERAAEAKAKWGLDRLALGYGLSIDQAREWVLYVSTHRGKTSVGIEEPALFSEPGVCLMRPDRTLYWMALQTMPFARPHFDEILAAMDFAIDKGYPARGEAWPPGGCRLLALPTTGKTIDDRDHSARDRRAASATCLSSAPCLRNGAACAVHRAGCR